VVAQQFAMDKNGQIRGMSMNAIIKMRPVCFCASVDNLFFIRE